MAANTPPAPSEPDALADVRKFHEICRDTEYTKWRPIEWDMITNIGRALAEVDRLTAQLAAAEKVCPICSRATKRTLEAEAQLADARDALTRVDAFPAKWRAYAKDADLLASVDKAYMAEGFANDLEAALGDTAKPFTALQAKYATLVAEAKSLLSAWRGLRDESAAAGNTYADTRATTLADCADELSSLLTKETP